MSPQEVFWNSWFGVSIAATEIAAVLAIVVVALTLASRRLLKTSS